MIDFMDSEINICFDDRVVVLTGKRPAIDNDRLYIFKNRQELAQRLERFENSDDERLYITHRNLNELFEYFAGCFKYIEAAGGLVTLPDGRILMIRRLGKWDLPKGKCEKGETLQETAIREVMEECGLAASPVITGELINTFHTYYRKGNHVLKRTAWFTMTYNGDDALHPQLDEDITEAMWISENQLNIFLQNTYKSIEQVFGKLKIEN